MPWSEMSDETSEERLPRQPAPETPAAAEPAPEEKPWFDWSNDLKFQWYMEWRNGYSAGARDSYSRYDQTIAGVSAGAIVLSITFLKDLGYTPTSLKLLYASWIVFLVAGGASLYSLRTSADCDIENLTQLENLRKTGKIKPERAKSLGRKTVVLNRISLGSFVLGILLVILFAFANYSVLEERKSEKEKERPVHLKPELPSVPSSGSAQQSKPEVPKASPKLPDPASPGSTSPKASPETLSPSPTKR